MAMTWETVPKCVLCGSENTSVYLNSDVPPWYQKQPINLLECGKCHLVRADPRPERQALYKNYLAGADNVKLIVERKLARPNVGLHHRRAIEEAMTYADRKVERLYDMGCGAGTVMMEARELGLEAQGNDVNKASVDMLKEKGFKAFHGFTRDLTLPSDYFDVVMNLDYLEHSYEPLDDLKTCLRLLRKGGVLYLKTLYLDCPAHKEQGVHWNLLGNGHFHYFFPDTLRELMTKAGFGVLDLKLGGLVTVIGLKR